MNAYQPDAYDATPATILERALKRVTSGELPSDRFSCCLVLILDKENGAYNVSQMTAGMTTSEAIALLEYTKAIMVNAMLATIKP